MEPVKKVNSLENKILHTLSTSLAVIFPYMTHIEYKETNSNYDLILGSSLSAFFILVTANNVKKFLKNKYYASALSRH